MLKTGIDLFAQLPDEAERPFLHRGTVSELAEDLCTVGFENTEIDLYEGREVPIFYELQRKFVQQASCIEEVVEREPVLRVRLRTIGDPVSAETREHYRVSTLSADVAAQIGKEKNCPVQDIGGAAFAVIASGHYSLDTALPARVRYQDQEYSGKVCVKSVRELGSGQTRYGFRVIDDGSDSSLREGLKQISLEVEREQDRRPSGGG